MTIIKEKIKSLASSNFLYVLLIIFLGSAGISQPKLSLDLGIGFYQPTLTGFDENVIAFPSKSSGVL